MLLNSQSTFSTFIRCAVLGLIGGSAFAESAKVEVDPQELLQRIRSGMRAHLSQLSSYTCRAVIDRMARSPRSPSLQHVDRVELEVAFSGAAEMFAKSSEASFQNRPIQDVVPSGTIASAPLGSYVDSMVSNDIADFKYAGTGKKDGHKTYRYDFHVSEDKNVFLVRHQTAEAYVAFKGSIWVDTETLDPVRVEVKTEHIPSRLEVMMVEETLHYGTMTIGNSQFVLPQHSELTTLDSYGNYSFNDLHLEACKEFSGQATVTFGSPTGGASRQESPKQ